MTPPISRPILALTCATLALIGAAYEPGMGIFVLFAWPVFVPWLVCLAIALWTPTRSAFGAASAFAASNFVLWGLIAWGTRDGLFEGDVDVHSTGSAALRRFVRELRDLSVECLGPIAITGLAAMLRPPPVADRA